MEIEQKREIVTFLLNKGIIVDRESLTLLDTITEPELFKTFILTGEFNEGGAIRFIDVINKYGESSLNEKEQQEGVPPSVNIIFSYQEESKKREVRDFTAHFTARYNSLKAILQNRKELQNLTSINRLNQKREREQAAIICIITEKQLTKTGKYALTVEDPTGQLKVIVSESSDAFELVKESGVDEVVGIAGMCMGNMLFANSIILPDIPAYKEIKKSPDESYSLFMGDFHFGSKVFLKEPFEKFISWIRGEQGSEAQRQTVRKIKYLFMVGDLVEGVGIYPEQDKDLEIIDIYAQYNEFAKHLKRIPERIKIIICPGNHDAMRLSEPQPPLYKDFAEAVWKLPNVVMVSNPSYVNIHASNEFPGFDILMYHGFSYPYYADTVESIRSKGGQERVDLIMQFLLQRRHLAPEHASTLYLPDPNKDSLVIDKIPDFFVSGHIHRVSVASYRNVTTLNCSCWLATTDYQEKMGLHPQPGRAILVNLQTRKIKIIKFYDENEEEKDAATQ